MKKLFSSFCASALVAATFAFGSVAQAGPMNVQVPSAPSNLHLAQGMDGYGGGNWRANRNYRQYRGGPRYGHYRGHRGYRHARPGYRYHNGFWFPPAAFIAGAIIGGAIASQPAPAYGMNNAHVQWCYDRYRSYRAADNSFQPYNGPRQQCRSPYY